MEKGEVFVRCWTVYCRSPRRSRLHHSIVQRYSTLGRPAHWIHRWCLLYCKSVPVIILTTATHADHTFFLGNFPRIPYNDLSIILTVIEIVDSLQIDDPVGAVGVHWGGGFWAMIATGLFAQHDKGSPATSGVFHHGNGELLGWNVAAALVVTLWSATTTALVVRTLNLIDKKCRPSFLASD